MSQFKFARVLTQAARENIPAKKFAIPEAKAKRIGDAKDIPGEAKGKYPIPDAAHARNALSRVSQFGSSAEKATVRAKVHAQYPAIGEEKKSSHLQSAFKLGASFAESVFEKEMAKVSTHSNAGYSVPLAAAMWGPLGAGGIGAVKAPEGESISRGLRSGGGSLLGGLAGGLGGAALGGLGGYGLGSLADMSDDERAKLTRTLMAVGGTIGGLGGSAYGASRGYESRNP